MMHSFATASSGQFSATLVFWLCAGLIAYAYAGYPLLLMLLAVIIRRPLSRPTDEPTLTLLICARNEEASIENKLQNVLALHYPAEKLQILVVSDGSTDATDAIVSSFADRGVELLRLAVQSGKTHAQNIAVLRATGDIVVFSDATTNYDLDALRFLAGNYVDPRVGAVSGRHVYLDATRQSPNGAGAGAFSSYDSTVRHLQSQIWSISGCCGCIYSVRRQLYVPLRADIISDLVEPLHILRQGFRVVLDQRAVAWEAATSTQKQEFSMRVRVTTRALAGLLSVRQMLAPWRHPWIAFQLWSHKLLRWAVPLFLIGLLGAPVALAQQPFYRVALAIQILFYATAWVAIYLPLHRRWPPLSLPLYFCIINAAAAVGFIQLMRGRRYTTWSPDRRATHAGN